MLKRALARARELNRSPDKFLRISRDPHVVVASPATPSPSRLHHPRGSVGGGGGYFSAGGVGVGVTLSSDTPSDADMVLSIFLHLCDDLARKSGKSDSYPPSHTLFSEDLAGVLQLSYHATAALRSGSGAAAMAGGGGVAGPLVGVVRQTGANDGSNHIHIHPHVLPHTLPSSHTHPFLYPCICLSTGLPTQIFRFILSHLPTNLRVLTHRLNYLCTYHLLTTYLPTYLPPCHPQTPQASTSSAPIVHRSMCWRSKKGVKTASLHSSSSFCSLCV